MKATTLLQCSRCRTRFVSCGVFVAEVLCPGCRCKDAAKNIAKLRKAARDSKLGADSLFQARIDWEIRCTQRMMENLRRQEETHPIKLEGRL